MNIIKIEVEKISILNACPKCRSENIYQKEDNTRIWYCPDCSHTFVEPIHNMIFDIKDIEKFVDNL